MLVLEMLRNFSLVQLSSEAKEPVKLLNLCLFSSLSPFFHQHPMSKNSSLVKQEKTSMSILLKLLLERFKLVNKSLKEEKLKRVSLLPLTLINDNSFSLGNLIFVSLLFLVTTLFSFFKSLQSREIKSFSLQFKCFNLLALVKISESL
jgi:hypothetical protein